MKVLERGEINGVYKWDLSHIFESDEAWEKTFSALAAEKDTMLKFKGKLNDGTLLLECLDTLSEISKKLYKLYAYSHMAFDADTRSTKYNDMYSRVKMLSVKLSASMSYIDPEILTMSEEKISALAVDPAFSNHDYYLKKLAKSKKHVLSETEEALLSETGSFSGGFSEAFTMFDNADVKFRPVIDENGEKVEMSHGNYAVLLQSPDRNVRKKAFNSMFSAFEGMKNTLAAMYAGNVKLGNFYAKVRKYKSALEKSMSAENVSPAVYQNLVAAVHKNIGKLHRYMSLRKELLGVPKLHMYDMHVSLFEGENVELKYEEACELVKDALKPLGKEYAELLDKAFSEGWIDVYETKGKRSGAYSSGAYGVHPYVLLNYKQTTHDVFTIAHELGHAMHTYYSEKNQCFEKADYEIFVAEVASTVNEVLLLKHMMKTADGTTKKFLLSYYLDMFRTTVFRQTQFAEFEEKVHSAAAKDVTLTADFLNDTYYKLNKKYYGGAVVSDKLIASEWSRIPHFYRAFYVYKYATGLSSAVIIAKRILSGDKNAVSDYFSFLSAGGSTDPVSVLRLAGVDLEKPETLNEAFEEFENTLRELEELTL